MRVVRLIKVAVDRGIRVTREYRMFLWFAHNPRLMEELQRTYINL